jgi:VanZ family protein
MEKLSRRWITLVLVVYWIGLTIGTHTPSILVPQPTDHTDKIYHFSAFAGLAFLAALAFDVRRFVLAGVLLAGYAAIDESTQYFVGRDVDILDWCANTSGICVGLLIAAKVLRRRDRTGNAR